MSLYFIHCHQFSLFVLLLFRVIMMEKALCFLMNKLLLINFGDSIVGFFVVKKHRK